MSQHNFTADVEYNKEPKIIILVAFAFSDNIKLYMYCKIFFLKCPWVG